MMKYHLQLLVFVFMVMLGLPAAMQAQYMLGAAQNSHRGLHAYHLNPAAIAGSSYKIQVNLVTAEGYFGNNYMHWNGPKALPSYLLSGEKFDTDFLAFNVDGKDKLMHGGFDIKGPAAMFSIGNSAIAIGTRLRGGIQTYQASESFMELARHGLNATDLQGDFNDNTSFAFNGDIFSEFSLSYGYSLELGKNHLHIGLTAKKLNGIYSANALNNDMQYTIGTEGSVAFMDIENLDMSFGYSRSTPGSDKILEQTGLYDIVFGNEMMGAGYGVDLGVLYDKYLPNGERLFSLGAAIIDIGSIHYNDGKQYAVSRNNLQLGETDLELLSEIGPEALVDILSISPTEKATNYRTTLPSMIHINGDFRLNKVIYFQANLIQSVRVFGITPGYRTFSQFTVSPRITTKWFEFGLPISLINDYETTAFGFFMRMGTLMIGSDNLAFGKANGANIYAGLHVPIFKN